MEKLKLSDRLGYGTTDFFMTCSTGTELSIFHVASHIGHYEKEIRCDSQSNYGFQGLRSKEQDNYGIMNAAMRCSGEVGSLQPKPQRLLGGGLTRFLPLFAAAALADLLQ